MQVDIWGSQLHENWEKTIRCILDSEKSVLRIIIRTRYHHWFLFLETRDVKFLIFVFLLLQET